jgi:hypothetical protein
MRQCEVMTQVYEASSIKRLRSTRDEVEARRYALLDIIAKMRPTDSANGEDVAPC